MNFFIFSCGIVPLAVVIGFLYFIMRGKGLDKQSILAKCGGSFLYVYSAGFAVYASGGNPLTQLIFWFAVLCMIADGLLEAHFISGMLTFGIAHILLITWLLWQAPPTWYSLAVWAPLMVCTALLFRKYLKRIGFAKSIPYALYAGILVADFAVALPLVFSAGLQYLPLAAGTLIFFISDLFVAQSHFDKIKPRQGVFLMILYWGALYLITSTLWALG